LIACCAAQLAACTRHGNQGPTAQGQIVARVADQAVTSLELDDDMRVANVAFDKRNDPVVLKQILSEIVLRKYLVQQALAAKLDQQPNILLDIMRSREQVLARAELARKTADVAVSGADIDQYIAANPARFANRELWTVDQIRFPIEANIHDVLDANRAAASLDDIEARLKALHIPYIRSVAQLSQSDLLEPVAHALQSNKADTLYFGQLGSNGLYFKVKERALQPLEGVEARALARRELKADAEKQQLTELKLAAARETTYSAEYAHMMAPALPSGTAVAAEPK
jgi:EpsD family peptidyl-prolyl cis-trans isomerase